MGSDFNHCETCKHWDRLPHTAFVFPNKAKRPSEDFGHCGYPGIPFQKRALVVKEFGCVYHETRQEKDEVSI
jgi:hypothetical protein